MYEPDPESFLWSSPVVSEYPLPQVTSKPHLAMPSQSYGRRHEKQSQKREMTPPTPYPRNHIVPSVSSRGISRPTHHTKIKTPIHTVIPHPHIQTPPSIRTARVPAGEAVAADPPATPGSGPPRSARAPSAHCPPPWPSHRACSRAAA